MAWDEGTGNMLFLLSIGGHFSQGDGPSEVRLGGVVDSKLDTVRMRDLLPVSP